MTQTFTARFEHRVNDDGTIDSICRECFVTVATAISKPELEREEREHNCAHLPIDRYKNCLYSEIYT
jgi:hypothetical protein